MKILCLSGSLRAQSSSTAVMHTVAELLPSEVETVHFDIGLLPHYNADQEPEVVKTLKDAIAEADGLVIVTPEYNYSIPGVLKNAIDWASRPAYQSVFRAKPVFVVSVSGGALGGVRAQSHLKYILNGMLAEVFVWQEIAVAHAPTKVSGGRLKDQPTIDFLKQPLDQFVLHLSKDATGKRP